MSSLSESIYDFPLATAASAHSAEDKEESTFSVSGNMLNIMLLDFKLKETISTFIKDARKYLNLEEPVLAKGYQPDFSLKPFA